MSLVRARNELVPNVVLFADDKLVVLSFFLLETARHLAADDRRLEAVLERLSSVLDLKTAAFIEDQLVIEREPTTVVTIRLADS